VVEIICSGWLGTFGAIIAILGVVAAPITSGDTAFRSARLIIAEALGMEQRTIVKRLLIAIPMFIASILLLVWQIENPNGFNTIWQYFGWANQTLSVFSLWTITIYLTQRKKPFIITLIPALFMTMVCSTFLFVSQQAFGMDYRLGVCLGVLLVVGSLVLFLVKFRSLYGSAK
jgi:carbon starvation protein CstA